MTEITHFIDEKLTTWQMCAITSIHAWKPSKLLNQSAKWTKTNVLCHKSWTFAHSSLFMRLQIPHTIFPCVHYYWPEVKRSIWCFKLNWIDWLNRPVDFSNKVVKLKFIRIPDVQCTCQGQSINQMSALPGENVAN